MGKHVVSKEKTQLRWMVGMQHFSGVSTKDNPDWEYYHRFMQTNTVHLNQDPAAVAIKEPKRTSRAVRKQIVSVEQEASKEALETGRRQKVAASLTAAELQYADEGSLFVRGMREQ